MANLVINDKTPAAAIKRVTIHDIRRENSESVYVRNIAVRKTKQPTTIMLTHRFDNGNEKVINLFNTAIPIDLTLFIPKGELLSNPEFMSLVGRGHVELVATEAAEKELNTPDGQAESDRVQALYDSSFVGTEIAEMELPNQGLKPSDGVDIDEASIGVAPLIADAFLREDMSDTDRIVVIRNNMAMLTDRDKTYIRQRTENEAILKLIA